MSAAPEHLLDVQDLGVRFGGLRAVDGLSFAVRRGEVFGLIGPNGAGKSTCFNSLCGNVRPTSGEIRFRGELVTGEPPFEMARRGMARTFQLTSLFGRMSVGQNLLIAMHLHRRGGTFSTFFQSRRYRQELERLGDAAHEILAFLELDSLYDSPAGSLTFAQQRWLEIAIALALRPELLLLDEPAAGLSPAETEDLSKLIRAINARGTTVLLIEHNMRFIMSLCDRLCVLNYGSKCAEGVPAEIAVNPTVRDIYLGTDHDDA